ncbi:MAG: Hpt domain-containing protein [Alphaproteobacteria bacterium]|nr:Hpt domain-containing protein [Alphaproteobacteria bacterium]
MSDDPLIDSDALARAEAALAALSKQYLSWADADLTALRRALADRDWDGLHRIAHNTKGQAATFGYPLVSILAGRLCALILTHGQPEPEQWRQAQALVDGIGRVLVGSLTGDGGEAGQQLLAELS